jgi:parvulin-like peptidyl-prolyl isomerase
LDRFLRRKFVKLKLLKRALATLSGALLLMMLMTAVAFAQEEGAPTVVDEVVAQVNNDVITLSMVKRELNEAKVALVREQHMTEAQAEAEVTKRQPEIIAALINEQLIMQKGKELGIVDDVEKQVNEQLLQIAKEQGNIKTVDQLEAAMRAEGLDPATIRQTMRLEATKNMVLGNEVDRKIFFGLTDTEVKNYYEAHKDKFRKPETWTLSEIFLSSVGKPDAEVLARAQKLVATLRAGGDFAATAKTESEAEDRDGKRIAAETGGKIGTFTLADISNQQIADALKSLKTGGITEPIKGEQGYTIFHVDERTPAGEPVFEENKVREAMTYERMPKEREAYLAKLRQEAYVKVSDNYKEAVAPFLKTEAEKTASANQTPPTPAPVTTTDNKKNNKKHADSYKKP